MLIPLFKKMSAIAVATLIRTDAELLAFALRLQKAQCATKKRKATYLGNSVRSKQRWRAEGKKKEAAGFPSVMKYFQKQPDKVVTLEAAGKA
jgi:hypothetical protein